MMRCPTLPTAVLTTVLTAVAHAGAWSTSMGCQAAPRDLPGGRTLEAVPVPEVIPTWQDHADFVGAKECAPCHQDAYRAWQASPHGQSMARPSPRSVAGRFDGARVELEDGAGVALRVGDAYVFELSGPGGRETFPVELVLATGRTHQLYLTQTPDGRYRLLPVYWASLPGRWASLSMYRPSSVDPGSPRHWAHRSLLGYACMDCHASQVRYRRVGGTLDVPGAVGNRFRRPSTHSGRQLRRAHLATEWVDLSVNCEACHGPGREHVRSRRAGRPGSRYADLRARSADDDVRLCGACHAYKVPLSPDADERGLRQDRYYTLAYHGFRPDGTQRGTVYQTGGHLLSECYQQGALGCSTCHAPHDLSARDLTGASAEGHASNRQCTVCHRDLAAPLPAQAHSEHPPAVRCVDCHMAYSWMLDTPASHQRTSDHSISIPRPVESAELSLPNACTTCHTDRSDEWAAGALRAAGRTEALAVREWVRTVAMGKEKAGGATARLLDLVGRPSTGGYLRASALALLADQPPSTDVVHALGPLVRHPSPEVRAYALRALMRHDAAGATGWRGIGSADPDALVRLTVFGAARHPETLTDAALARAAQDTAERALSPEELVAALAEIAEIYLRRQDRPQARRYLEAAHTWATPEQAQSLQLDTLGWLAGKRSKWSLDDRQRSTP